jgi:hypothetical protein
MNPLATVSLASTSMSPAAFLLQAPAAISPPAEAPAPPAEAPAAPSSPTPEQSGPWSCRACTYLNTKVLGLACEMCGLTRHEDAQEEVFLFDNDEDLALTATLADSPKSLSELPAALLDPLFPPPQLCAATPAALLWSPPQPISPPRQNQPVSSPPVSPPHQQPVSSQQASPPQLLTQPTEVDHMRAQLRSYFQTHNVQGQATLVPCAISPPQRQNSSEHVMNE